MSESAIGKRGAWDRREPAVADGELTGERGEDGNFIWRKTARDALRVGWIVGFALITEDKAVHRGVLRGGSFGVAVKLGERVKEGVSRIGSEVAGEAGIA